MYRARRRDRSLFLGCALAGLCALIFACGESEVTDPLARVPARLDIIGGQGQSGVVATELPEAIVVRVLDVAGEPVAGQIINFTVVKGGGRVFAGTALANSDGVASERWTLGTSVADSQIVEARAVDPVSGNALVFGRFIATARPGAPATVAKVQGDTQSAVVGTALPLSLSVQVRDLYNNLVPGTTVAWSVDPDGGTVTAASSSTDSAGTASATWTLGSVPGTRTARVLVGDSVAATFSATANPEPVLLSKIAGDDQFAEPGSAVAVDPAVKATNSDGTPEGGVTIRFAVTGGGGSVTGADAVSDADGVARVGSWILGPTAGANALSATSPSGSTVTFSATGSHIQPGFSLSKHEGDNQTASPGGAVAVAPAVRVTNNQTGNVESGVTVTFAVATGGGTVTGANAVSDASGVARVGSWTLGTSAGVNTLTASSTDAASVTFTATSAQTSPDISIDLTAPAAGLVGDTVAISASITSKYQLAGVTARLADKSTALTTTKPGIWQGTLSLAGEPRDTVSLFVRATDVNGAVTEVVRLLTHDRKPRVVVTAPFDGSVARPTTVVDAACDDDDPNGCTLLVRRDGTVVAGPTPSPLRATISLASSEGDASTIVIEARDSRNQLVTASRTLFVESSSRLELIGAGDGTVLDARDSRLLLVRRSEYADVVVIHEIASGVAETRATSGTVSYAFLTPQGAAFTSWNPTIVSSLLYLWHGASITTRELNSTFLAYSGDFVIYTGPPNGLGPLYRMNVVTGEEVLVADATGNINNDVADNGDVAYWVPYNIVRYRGSTNTPVTNDATSDRWNTYPVTDGVNIVFRRHASCCSSMELWIYDGASLAMLAARSYEFVPGRDYAAENGWTAFTKLDASGYNQVWTRSPAGVQRQVTAFGSSSILRALAGDGAVILDNGYDRYHAGPAGSPVRISSTLGTVLWRDGRFVTILGNSAFAIVP